MGTGTPCHRGGMQSAKELRTDALSQERRKHQTGDIGRACTEREAGAAKRGRRGGIESGDDDPVRDGVSANGDPHGRSQRPS